MSDSNDKVIEQIVDWTLTDWIVSVIHGCYSSENVNQYWWYKLGFVEGIIAGFFTYICLVLLPSIGSFFVPENSSTLVSIFIELAERFLPFIFLLIINKFGGGLLLLMECGPQCGG